MYIYKLCHYFNRVRIALQKILNVFCDYNLLEVLTRIIEYYAEINK